MNRFIRAYNSFPNKIGGYLVTDSLDKMHLPKGLCFSLALNLKGGGIFEIRYTQRKYFSEAGGPGPVSDPGTWHRDIKVSMPTVGFSLIQIYKSDGNVDFGYGGSLDITTGNMQTRNTTVSQTYKKIQGFFNIGLTPFLQYYIHPFGRSSPIMVGIKPYYQMNIFRNNFEQMNVEATNYFGTKALKARGSNLGIEAQIMIDLGKKEKKEKIAKVKKEKVIVQKPVEVEPVKTVSAFVISGKTLDAKMGQEIPSEIEVVSSNGQKKYNVTAGADGNYKVELPEGGSYTVTAKSQGYLALNETIQVDGALNKDLKLTPIEVGATFELKNLFFDQGKAVILEASYPELDKLVKIMQENPGIEIELRGHTDNVGDPDKNMKLSKDRVTVVENYLISKGISAKRIAGKGFGGTHPIAKDNTPEAHKLNRRVEFVITKK